MFIPKINELKDTEKIYAFMQRFSFAIIITEEHLIPIATHLPFVVTLNNDKLILSSHFAKANSQWKNIEAKNVLVIFSEPNAYISPKHYDNKVSVPTWDYISVHAYGKAKLIMDNKGVLKSLENTIKTFEKEYMPQWESLPKPYIEGMLKEIVAFEIEIDKVEAKEKLSQNKNRNEKARISNTLLRSENINEKIIGEYIHNQNKTNTK